MQKMNLRKTDTRGIFMKCMSFAVLLSVIYMLPSLALCANADRYFNQAEMAGYSVPNSDNGDTFYVDTKNGLDTNNGLSESLAFKTLAKALDKYRSNKVVGGDVIKIKAGIYRETLSLSMTSEQSSSLTTDKPLIIGPYGDGEVIIDPSPTPTNWTQYNSNIFVADWTHSPESPWAVILNDDFKRYRDKRTLEELTTLGFWYYDTNNKKIYIHTGGVNPAQMDPVITYYNRSAEHYAIKLNGYSHIRVYGLTLRGAARYGVTDYAGILGEDVIIEKCTIKYNNQNGVRLFSSRSKLIKNHIHGNMLYNWPRGRIYGADGGWGQGATISNYGLASGNISHDNGGEGIGIYGGSGHTVFEDNISYDNYSVGLYLDNAPYCTFRRNFVYSHDPDPRDLAETWQLPQWIQDGGTSTIDANLRKIFARMRQEGIMTGDEKATNPIAQGVGHKIYNNIIIGARRGYLHYNNSTGSGLRNYIIANNTIVLPSIPGDYGQYAGMIISNNGGNNTGTVIKNNIIYSPTSDPIIILSNGNLTTGIELDKNLYFAPNNVTPFLIGSYPSEVNVSFENWKQSIFQNGDTQSLFADPLFSGNTGEFAVTNYSLLAQSPARGIGVIFTDFSEDFEGLERGALWDLGAMSFSSTGEATIPDGPNNLRILLR